MKFSGALTSLILLVPLFAGEALGATPYRRQGNNGNKNNGNGGNNKNGNGGNNNNNAANASAASAAAASAANTAVASAASAAAASAASTAATGAAANNTANAAGAGAAANGNNNDPQSSLSVYYHTLLSDDVCSNYIFPLSPISSRSGCYCHRLQERWSTSAYGWPGSLPHLEQQLHQFLPYRSQ